MEENRNSQQNSGTERSSANQQQGKNETLQEGSANSVTDYGRAEERLEREHGMNSDRQGNSSIPTGNDETLGNP